jgi:hypothetical protein
MKIEELFMTGAGAEEKDTEIINPIIIRDLKK